MAQDERTGAGSVGARIGTGPGLTEALMGFRNLLAAEVGTEADCPFCHEPRVRRSTYIRCNGCGVNWRDGENLDVDPRWTRSPWKRPWGHQPGSSKVYDALEDALTVTAQSKSVGTSAGGAE